jgi:hypothetical protein
MSDGPDDIEPDDGGNPEDGPILSPEELEIAKDQHVTQLDEGRFVVSPDARQQSNKPQQEESDQRPDDEAEKTRPQSPKQHSTQSEPGIAREEVHEWLRESFRRGGSRYGFDVTAIFDGSVSQRRMASNDVVTIFESLIVWYAQQIDEDTPVEEILGILLMEANVPVRYPPESLKGLVKSRGLEPEDKIADLLAAIDKDEGIEL